MKTNDFTTALDRLERMAKGTGQTQLFATPSDSNPGTWAGSTQEDVNEHEDGIDENGTDYAGVKKSLAAKVAKSQALTPAEVAIVKGENPLSIIGTKIAKGGKLTSAEKWAIAKGFPFDKDEDEDHKEPDGDEGEMKSKKSVKKASTSPSKAPASGNEDDSKSVPETNAGKDTTAEDEAAPEGSDAKKSFVRAVSGSSDLRKGIEMSPILFEMTRAIGEALQGVERGVVAQLTKSFAGRIERIESALGGFAAEQGEFAKSMAEAVAGIGQHLVNTAQVQTAAAAAPVSAPKSQLRVMQKSFGPGGLEISAETMAKSQVVEVMADLVQKGRLSALDVIKFESTGEISPAAQSLVHAAAAGK